jgi:hypothetical protein
MKTINKKTTIMTSITIATVLLMGFSLPSTYAAIDSVVADVVEYTAPADVTDVSVGIWEHDTEIRVFQEKDTYQLTVDVDLDITDDGAYGLGINETLSELTLEPGDLVNSYLVHIDRSTTGNFLTDYDGEVTFDNDIIGVIIGTQSLADSDDELGHDDVFYPGAQTNRGLDWLLNNADAFTINGNTLTLDTIQTGNAVDDIRVVTVAPAAFDAEKSWTHTDYNWDPVCDGIENVTGCFTLDGTSLLDLRPSNINATDYPEDHVLAEPLDNDGLGNYTAFAQVHKNKFSNTNPGAFYALTTINVEEDLDSLQVDEIYEDCTVTGDDDILKFVSKKPTRNVKIAVANSTGFVTELTSDLYDDLGGNVTADINSATVHITDSENLAEGSTVFVLVKFQDNLKNEPAPNNLFEAECDNTEVVTGYLGDSSQIVDANATLLINNLD